MDEDQPSSSAAQRSSGMETRLSRQQRMNQRATRSAPGSSGRTPGGSLTSPQPTMDTYFAPRKSQRLASRPSRTDSLRQIRQKGHSGTKPALPGHLGTLPQEVRAGAWATAQIPLPPPCDRSHGLASRAPARALRPGRARGAGEASN